MARYIDIDLLIEAVEDTDWYHISKQGELVHGANSKDDIPLYKHADIVAVLNNAPIADVVPKSEVEELKEWVEAYKNTIESMEKIDEELRAEIERLQAKIKILTEPEDFDELKKKYTEGEE